MNHMARTLAWFFLAWTALYLVWGGTSSGNDCFSNIAKQFFEDYKGGVPLITLAVPMLAATIVSIALWRREEYGESSAAQFLPRWIRRLQHSCRFQLLVGDATAPQVVSWSFMALLGFSMLGSFQRKILSDDDLDWDEQVMKTANILGLAGLVAMCMLLVPVTKHSPLIKVFGLSEPTAMTLHQYTGRFVVIACLMHGIGHVYTWTVLAGEGFGTMILPPAACWTLSDLDEEDEPTICRFEDTEDCSCYDIFKNLAGAVAGLGLAVIAVSSLGPVRRLMYGLFYRIHVIAGPLVFVAVVFHWNRSVLYLTGGMLYYLAMYAAAASENAASPGVTVVSAQRLQGTDATSFLSLTLQADARSVKMYRPTQYVKLKFPEISSIAHPFSINRVPNEPQKLRLIIREGGQFTRALAQRCVQEIKPTLYIDGFYGTETRLAEIEQHDVVVIIAGGIGITTYLTLLKETLQKPSRPDRRLRKILLHWICREAHLVDYVQREYLDDLQAIMNASACGIHLGITIHRTGSIDTYSVRRSSNGENRKNLEGIEIISAGQPFAQSRYSFGIANSLVENLPLLTTFLITTILGLVGVWYFYSVFQDSEEVFSRIWVLCYLVVLGLATGLFLKFGLAFCCRRPGDNDVEFVPIRSEDVEVEMETVATADGLVNLSAGGIQRSENCGMSMEESEGRPSIHTLLNPLEESKYPAVFSCGPARLMNEVKSKTLGRCRMRLQRWVSGEPRIALYEEAFEM